MSIAKSFVRGLAIAGLFGASAYGGSILTLGETSGDSYTVASPTVAPSSTGASTWTDLLKRLDATSESKAPASAPQMIKPSPWVAPNNPTPPPPAPVAVAVAPAPAPAPAPVPAPAPAPAPPAPIAFDAFVNLGSGRYAASDGLTTGNAQPWYASGPAAGLFGGTPTPKQIADFDDAVMQRLEKTFQLSGVPVKLTADPNTTAAHMLSVVSHTGSNSIDGVIGMTYLGGDGFHFIDQSAQAARSVGQLEWIVAHNLSHELMLAFGVPEVHDASGNFIDARTASWGMMVSPDSRFSTEATRDLLSKDFQSTAGSGWLQGAQLLDTRPVPEPSTIALWIASATALALARRARSRPESR